MPAEPARGTASGHSIFDRGRSGGLCCANRTAPDLPEADWFQLRGHDRCFQRSVVVRFGFGRRNVPDGTARGSRVRAHHLFGHYCRHARPLAGLDPCPADQPIQRLQRAADPGQGRRNGRPGGTHLPFVDRIHANGTLAHVRRMVVRRPAAAPIGSGAEGRTRAVPSTIRPVTSSISTRSMPMRSPSSTGWMVAMSALVSQRGRGSARHSIWPTTGLTPSSNPQTPPALFSRLDWAAIRIGTLVPNGLGIRQAPGDACRAAGQAALAGPASTTGV